jgi:hypothetical protein
VAGATESGEPIIILDENEAVRSVAERILQGPEFNVVAFATIQEGIAALSHFAPRRTTVILSSTLAAADTSEYDALRNSTPFPKVVLSCTRCGVCPIHPDLACANLGCLLKPEDFTLDRLRSRVTAIVFS